MTRSLTAALAATIAIALPLTAMPVAAGTAAASAKKTQARYSVEDTSLGTLLDDPASLAIIKTYAPTIISHPQVSMARPLTLSQLRRFAGDTLNEDVLAKIDAALTAAAPKS